MMRQGVKDWLEELVPQKGENAAKHEVAEAIAKELVAKGLIKKSQELASEDVEIKVPEEVVEEARGSKS
eukprot:8687885-Karenia_brevis.AAC.1